MTREQEIQIKDYVKKYADKHHITEKEAGQAMLISYYKEHVVNSIRRDGNDKLRK